MRAGLSTIQQTLTPEAASVLNHSIGEAARRNHGQTTPLHVAATLLAAPSGFLRQACIRSHPNSSHPLQCRALELCFSIALDRLPSTTTTTATGSTASAAVAEPPISNALMAALKRAQAHQRRGCPEQQQQPLLAVKVELEQLIVSILDDPSVSRVMREASFSSPAVKATIEQSLTAASSGQKSPSPTASATVSGGLGLGLGLGYRPPSRNLYMNPRLHQQQQQNQQPGIGGVAACGGDRREEVKRVVDILMRPRKRNPVLVGDSDPDAVMKEVLQRIENGDAPLRTAKVISLEKEFASDRSQIPSKIKELGSLIETQISTSGGGVILDLGDLKWLVESPGGFGTSTGSVPTQQQQQIVSETGRAAVAEMGKLLGRFGEGGVGSRVWLVGTATCATYLRCQVYHPTMENDWDLQAVPIAPRSPMPNMFPRLGGNGILSSSVETLTPLKGSSAMSATPIPLRPPSESPNPSRRTTLCLLCMENYERELAKLVAKEFEKSSSDSKPEAQQTLPQWLQIAKLSNGGSKSNTDQLQTKEQELMWKQSTEELLKRWRETCSRLHPNFHPAIVPERPMAPALSMPSAFSPTTLPRQTLQSKLQLPRNMPTLQMSNHHGPVLNSSSDRPSTPPGSPVKTDLVLGHSKVSGTLLEETHRERVKDFAGCKLDRFSDQQGDKIAGISDIASFKKLFKGLIDKVGWQPEAANVITNVVLQCKSGNGKRRGTGPKGDTWLLFIGHDKVGKKKMASALSELVFGTSPITVRLAGPRADGDDGESDVNFRGKTSLDRVAEAVRQNPFSVVVLEDVDRADALVQGTIKRAMERGRLPDSHGREVALGSVIFVLTADWLPENLKNSQNSVLESEEKILALANCGWQLELSVGESAGKRRADWLCEGGDRPIRPRMESAAVSGLSFDLNLTAGADEDTAEGSRNSSDLTVEHEHEFGRLAIKRAASSSASELIDSADESIMFKPVDFGPLRRKISESISTKFTSIMGNGRLIRIDEDTLDRMVGGIWLGGSTARFEGWTETVLVPSIQELKSSNSKGGDGVAVRLSSMPIKGCRMERNGGDWFPCKVNISVDGV